MIKWWLFAFLLFLSAARAAESVAIVEIFRDVPDIQDSYVILIYPDHEELSVTSNLFFLPRQEFGRYVRARTILPAKVDELIAAGAGFKKPESPTFNFTGWHAKLRDEEFDALDPRFQKTISLMVHEIKRGGWRRKEITVARLKRGVDLHVVQLEYSVPSRRLIRPHIVRRRILYGLEACQNVITRHLVCRADTGFVLLATPGQHYD